MTENHAAWAISPDVRATYSEDGAVLLDINKGMCYSLNAAGARIWITIESKTSGITLDCIVGALAAHYGAPYKQLEADTQECLDKLQRMGLVRCNGRVGSTRVEGRGG